MHYGRQKNRENKQKTDITKLFNTVNLAFIYSFKNPFHPFLPCHHPLKYKRKKNVQFNNQKRIFY
jgi:hypothetical protein